MTEVKYSVRKQVNAGKQRAGLVTLITDFSAFQGCNMTEVKYYNVRRQVNAAKHRAGLVTLFTDLAPQGPKE